MFPLEIFSLTPSPSLLQGESYILKSHLISAGNVARAKDGRRVFADRK
jgi:hypothetical protein